MKNHLPLLAVGLLVVVAVVVFLRAPGPVEDSDRVTRAHPAAAEGREAGSAMPTPATTPSARNVSHDFKARVADLEAKLVSNSRDTTALQELARLQFDAHAMAEAVTQLERYLDLHPANRQAWLDLATALGALGRWSEAESATARLLEFYPGDAAGAYNMGAILANGGKRADAAEWWRRVAASTDEDMARRARESLARLEES